MRFRLYPTPAQEDRMLLYCSHARLIWNTGLEQMNCWRPGRKSPSWVERSRQITEARSEFPWLAEVPRDVQEQALRDLRVAFDAWRRRSSGRPTWRKRSQHEGFRIGTKVEPSRIRRLGRRWGAVQIPGIGLVRFRWTRDPGTPKSFRIKRDAAGRWHVAFAVVPEPLPGPGDGTIVGIDRGVAVTLALSDGTTHQAPAWKHLERLQGRMSRAKRGSNRRAKLKHQLARAHARNADTRKDWVEKVTTEIARSYDFIRIEDLRIPNMVRGNRGLNREILRSGWGMFATRLEHKAQGRVERVPAAFTSQRCSECGHLASDSRKSQALFACVACNFSINADLNAAKNIAAGYAVTARGGLALAGPANREPH